MNANNSIRQRFAISGIALAAALLGLAQPAGANLIRNASFQDDWCTVVPEVKNHHWCFQMDHVNRRDYMPDGWSLKGNWEWRNADGPVGRRLLVLKGPDGRAAQQVNWVEIWDEKKLHAVGDAGTSPTPTPALSSRPERVVRSLTLVTLLQGKDVPENAGAVVLEWEGGIAASNAIPAGTYDEREIHVELPAEQWLAKSGGKLPCALPQWASVAVTYKGATGEVAVKGVNLSAAEPMSPNLLTHGGFEKAGAEGYPTGWSAQQKYTYFPPRNYYLFNTWHNTPAPNRGPVEPDSLIAHSGHRSLKMIVASGDEKYVESDPITLNQTEPRLIEVQVWVKTDSLHLLQLDGTDENGNRLWGKLWINKDERVSVGTEDWRLVRQVFRPNAPVKTFRLRLCARGANGYTLDDVGDMPQANVVGTIWWDDVRVFEPESTAGELAGRGVKPAPLDAVDADLRLENVDLGERLLGRNTLTTTIANPGSAREVQLRWEFTSPRGTHATNQTQTLRLPKAGKTSVELPYELTECCPDGYTEYRSTLSLVKPGGKTIESSTLWFGTWTTPVDIELGALYLPPDRKQFVRLNIGLAPDTMSRAASVRLEAVRRRTGKVEHTWSLPADPAAILARRSKIPTGLREDFRNLLLTDLDMSALPVQPFGNPQRNWILRVTVLDRGGRSLATADSDPFCRLAASSVPRPPVGKVTIDEHNLLYVNGAPWMPWGYVYGYSPTYNGPAESGTNFNMRALGFAGTYDRFVYDTREGGTFNCARALEGGSTEKVPAPSVWKESDLYLASLFCSGGATKFNPDSYADKYLEWCRTAPMVVSVAAGIEEAFGVFHSLDRETLDNYRRAVEKIRGISKKPVMVGHGGYWNRFEWEIASFFDIYDPETEPLYPAPLHTDWRPLFAGQKKVAWLRPQMYEDVPYERWRFHAFVEAMRGCRGWQFAHGIGDRSLFAGLHAELLMLEPVLYATEPGPAVSFTPSVEHWARKHDGQLYIIAATTHGMTLGNWRETDERVAEAGRVRVTESDTRFLSEANNYSVEGAAETGPRAIGVQYLPDCTNWPSGTRLTQWVQCSATSAPDNLTVFVKADGRWTHAGLWGKAAIDRVRPGGTNAHWFMSVFYKHAQGFAFDGWLGPIKKAAEVYLPQKGANLGAFPSTGQWVRLEIPLEKLDAADKLLDGVAFMHEGGAVRWGRTALVTPDCRETTIWDEAVGPSMKELASVKVAVEGLKEGTPVEVLFEDRELTAQAGWFTDDFRGRDLYQRYGGGPNSGYGDKPVALHIYRLKAPRGK